ncbi:MAG: response regulator transcription factor [Chloroflexi bacterium]|nr:response regulator transcription factor [Chloroflexota bacterium]
MPNTVLIIEDDPHTTELVRLYLANDGHEVLSAATGPAGLALARAIDPDLVVLDLMLPGLDGREVCREIRAESDVPIVMLTARVEEDNLLTGLGLGADDYVTKPFRPRELAARVKAVLRRSGRDESEGGEELAFGPIRVNLRDRKAMAGDVSLSLTPTEFRLLVLLLREPGRVFSREQIIDRALGQDFDGFDRTVDTHIYSLRRKLEKPLEGVRYIHTIYGMGYRLGNA